jgi:hypothetical protein
LVFCQFSLPFECLQHQGSSRMERHYMTLE